MPHRDTMNALDYLIKLTDSFRHCGWVNGLSNEQYGALAEADIFINSIGAVKRIREKNKKNAKRLKLNGYSIREIAKIMGFKNPGSVSHLLK